MLYPGVLYIFGSGTSGILNMDSRNGKIMDMLWILVSIEIRQSWTHKTMTF